MGSDSPPKKWGLREQREAYLRWFSLADDGLPPIAEHDALFMFLSSSIFAGENVSESVGVCW
jgi:EH domain-containing protein 1